MRINLGAAFSELFKGEEGGINVASLRPVTVYTPCSVKNIFRDFNTLSFFISDTR
jgi:hypothetical protein